MKIICSKENLKKGLDVVERIVGKNLTLPILNNILIQWSENFLKFTSTDLEIAITVKVPAKTIKEGSICVPVRIFNNFVSNLPDSSVEIEIKGNNFNIKCDEYSAIIKGFNSEDFPIIPKTKEEYIFNINSILLIKGLAQVSGITSLSNLRPEFTGIFFNIKNKQLKLAATDSFRLAEKTIFLSNEQQEEKSFILPLKTAQEVMRIFGNFLDENITVNVTSNQIIFKKQNQDPSKNFEIEILSRLIEGEFPSYEANIPQKYQTKAMLVKNNFLNQIKIASLFSSRVNDVKIKFDSDQQEIEVFSQNSELGENASKLKAKIEGEKKSNEANFNYKFIMDGINNVLEEELIFEMSGDGGPGVIKPVENKDYIYILMPLRTT